MRIETKKSNTGNSMVNPIVKKSNVNNEAVINSTIGYFTENLTPQCLHFPMRYK